MSRRLFQICAVRCQIVTENGHTPRIRERDSRSSPVSINVNFGDIS